MGLKDVGERLPPGFRFYPSDEELVCHYLYKKIANEESTNGTLVDIDLHSCEPWQLPEVAKLSASEWYFFTFRDRKYATGFRTNRATTTGYWKATGKDRPVFDPKTREIVGMRKTLVFYRNRAPNGIKTGWIMHEFRLECPPMPPKEDWVLCRVFHKSNRDTPITQILNQTRLSSSSSSLLPSLTMHDDESPLTTAMPTPPLTGNEQRHCITTSQQQVPAPTMHSGDHANSLIDNNMSASSSLNHSDHHRDGKEHNNVGCGFSFSELMDGDEGDEYGFLGSIDLLEGSSKFGGGIGYEQDNGSLSGFF